MIEAAWPSAVAAWRGVRIVSSTRHPSRGETPVSIGRQRPRGELEAAIMDALWDADEPLTAKDVVARIPDPRPALTTVLTVLDRLGQKGLVTRSDEARALTFAPARSRTDHAASLMSGALAATKDREAALLRFAGTLDGDDLTALRRALGGDDRA
nr:BlaI/MecI/CopY family transcriptional regulator [Clavibacter sp. VKM Ac-2873]